ncbi:MAG: purine-nucleoside phosphorylase [Planctomycetota bacterium]
MSEVSLLDEAILHFEARGVLRPQRVVVLGSGFKGFAAEVQDAVAIPFAEVPNWPTPGVEGHGGSVVFGTVGGVPLACLTGRVHLYEGWEPDEVVRPVRTLRRFGASVFLLTNAAGGIKDGLRPGDVMVIEDHLNLTGCSPLVGEHEPELGPRFPDQSRVWDVDLRARLHAADADLQRGVYAGLLGPSYETPAEIRMLKAIGADAVGMSTVIEAMALHAMGAQVCGLSLISNLAAGIAPTPLGHDEVLAAGRQAQARLTRVLVAFCAARGE